jgi:hypothetical protein
MNPTGTLGQEESRRRSGCGSNLCCLSEDRARKDCRKSMSPTRKSRLMVYLFAPVFTTSDIPVKTATGRPGLAVESNIYPIHFNKSGRPVPLAHIPESLTLVSTNIVMPDFYEYNLGEVIVSSRARRSLEQLVPGAIEYIEIKLHMDASMSPADAYYYINVLPQVQSIDWDRTNIEPFDRFVYKKTPEGLDDHDGPSEMRPVHMAGPETPVKFKPRGPTDPRIWHEVSLDDLHHVDRGWVLIHDKVWAELNKRFPGQLTPQIWGKPIKPRLLDKARSTFREFVSLLVLIWSSPKQRLVSAKTLSEHWSGTIPLPIVLKQSNTATKLAGGLAFLPDHLSASQGTVDYVNTLVAAGYTRAELPKNANAAYQIDYLATEVSNGGFGQFTHNGRNKPWLDLDVIESGLKQIGEPYASGFEDYRKFLVEEAKGVPPEAMPQPLQDFGERFGHNTSDLFAANGKWIKSVPEMIIVRDEDYETIIDKLIQVIPNRQKRLRKKERERFGEYLQDGPTIMSRLISAALDIPPISVGGGYGYKKIAPDGIPETEWYAESDGNIGALFYNDDRVIYCESYLYDGTRLTSAKTGWTRSADGELQPPLVKASDVAAAFGRDDVDPFTNEFVINREVIRLPRARVEEAKVAARGFPVWDAVDFALIGMKNESELDDIRCGLQIEREGQQRWCWEFVTKNKRMLTIVDLGSEIEVFDSTGTTIQHFTRANLNEAIRMEAWDTV